ncbi:MAG: tripartite tricarboxylate transporter substrate-binding protein [Burkholderiaceae bacterium]
MTDRRESSLGAGALAAAASSSAAGAAVSDPPGDAVLRVPGRRTDRPGVPPGEAAAKTLGQSVVVENKPGAGGTLAALSMRNARPDGYTLAQMLMGMFRIPHMQKTPSFDLINDFTYVVNLTGYTFGLVVAGDSPFKSIKDVVDYAKANPGNTSYGSTGVGTSPHLAIEEPAGAPASSSTTCRSRAAPT